MKNNVLVSIGCVSEFFTLVLMFISMSVNPWAALFGLPALFFIGYNVLKVAKGEKK